MSGFATIDIIVFVAYIMIIVGIGLWVSRDKDGHQKKKCRGLFFSW